MVKKILIGIVAAIVILLILAATRPDSFAVERSITIAAPANVAYANVSDFHKWDQWSPWEKLDKGMEKEFSGSDGTVGASYHWVGNDKVGEGRMTVDEVKADEKFGTKLDFLKPFEAHNHTEFTFVPDGNGTKVTWKMSGNHNFVGKVFSLFMDMDKMVGKDFEEGLRNLKSVSEKK